MSDKRTMNNHVHLIFPLIQDEENYPPVGSERLWAKKVGDYSFEVDNIPFFVKGVSSGDVVTAEEKEGTLYFKEVEKLSGNSTIRVVVFGDDNVKDKTTIGLRSDLEKRGCEIEISKTYNLISINVPPLASLKEVIEHLKKGAVEFKWDYEEAVLRQNIA